MLAFAEVHHNYLNTPRFTVPISIDIRRREISVFKFQEGFRIPYSQATPHSLLSAICVRVCTRSGNYVIDTQRIVGFEKGVSQ